MPNAKAHLGGERTKAGFFFLLSIRPLVVKETGEQETMKSDNRILAPDRVAVKLVILLFPLFYHLIGEHFQ